MNNSTNRLLLIDLAKGISILIMVGLHYLYVLYDAHLIDQSIIHSFQYSVASRIVALSFIALSTIVLWYRSQLIVPPTLWFTSLAKQVVKLSVAALLVTLATRYWLGETFVRFGILHLLAVVTLVNGIMFRLKLPRWWFLGFGLLLVFFGLGLMFFTVPVSGWEWLGLVSKNFASVDYVPVLPWLGVTWLCALVAPLVIKLAHRQQPALESKSNWNWLVFCGKHSLAIYLLHVPVLLLILWLIFYFLR